MWCEFLSKSDQRKLKFTHSLLFELKTNHSHESINITKKDIVSINKDLNYLDSPFKIINNTLTFTKLVFNTEQAKQFTYYKLSNLYYKNTTSIHFIKELLLNPGCTVQEMSDLIFVSSSHIYFLKDRINTMSILQQNNIQISIINNKLFFRGDSTTIAFFILDFFKSVFSNKQELFKKALLINIDPNSDFYIHNDILEIKNIISNSEDTKNNNDLLISLLEACFDSNKSSISPVSLSFDIEKNPFIQFIKKSFYLLKDEYSILRDRSFNTYVSSLTISYLFFSLSYQYYPSFLDSYDFQTIHNSKLLNQFEETLLLDVPKDQKIYCFLFINHIIGVLEAEMTTLPLKIFIHLTEPPHLELIIQNTIKQIFDKTIIEFVDNAYSADVILSSCIDIYDYPISEEIIYYSNDFFNELNKKNYLSFISKMIH
ncbi:hypothetical protein OL233_08275 [Vagococcus sp. PNs007]|uniref:Mga helix-turn-helix domain-containing protein n=1 Tax=Vagococcus proximus TaxID=2991417 RepID=A0ABT5X2P7_9ENTE|nr:hypothetical protein [Vagococcus proximus]MDF0480278.1 hypothetical protein [Vagococcus proximus]